MKISRNSNDLIQGMVFLIALLIAGGSFSLESNHHDYKPTQYLIGPVFDSAEAELVRSTLDSYSIDFQQKTESVEESLGYIVLTPPFLDLDATNEHLAEMRRAGLTDLVQIRRDVYRNRVSAGVFSRLGSAELRRSSVLQSGFEVEVFERKRTRTSSWYMFSLDIAVGGLLGELGSQLGADRIAAEVNAGEEENVVTSARSESDAQVIADAPQAVDILDPATNGEITKSQPETDSNIRQTGEPPATEPASPAPVVEAEQPASNARPADPDALETAVESTLGKPEPVADNSASTPLAPTPPLGATEEGESGSQLILLLLVVISGILIMAVVVYRWRSGTQYRVSEDRVHIARLELMEGAESSDTISSNVHVAEAPETNSRFAIEGYDGLNDRQEYGENRDKSQDSQDKKSQDSHEQEEPDRDGRVTLEDQRDQSSRVTADSGNERETDGPVTIENESTDASTAEAAVFAKDLSPLTDPLKLREEDQAVLEVLLKLAMVNAELGSEVTHWIEYVYQRSHSGARALFSFSPVTLIEDVVEICQASDVSLVIDIDKSVHPTVRSYQTTIANLLAALLKRILRSERKQPYSIRVRQFHADDHEFLELQIVDPGCVISDEDIDFCERVVANEDVARAVEIHPDALATMVWRMQLRDLGGQLELTRLDSTASYVITVPVETMALSFGAASTNDLKVMTRGFGDETRASLTAQEKWILESQAIEEAELREHLQDDLVQNNLRRRHLQAQLEEQTQLELIEAIRRKASAELEEDERVEAAALALALAEQQRYDHAEAQAREQQLREQHHQEVLHRQSVAEVQATFEGPIVENLYRTLTEQHAASLEEQSQLKLAKKELRTARSLAEKQRELLAEREQIEAETAMLREAAAREVDELRQATDREAQELKNTLARQEQERWAAIEAEAEEKKQALAAELVVEERRQRDAIQRRIDLEEADKRKALTAKSEEAARELEKERSQREENDRRIALEKEQLEKRRELLRQEEDQLSKQAADVARKRRELVAELAREEMEQRQTLERKLEQEASERRDVLASELEAAAIVLEREREGAAEDARKLLDEKAELARLRESIEKEVERHRELGRQSENARKLAAAESARQEVQQREALARQLAAEAVERRQALTTELFQKRVAMEQEYQAAKQALQKSTHKDEQTTRERQVAGPGPTTALENQDHNAQREHWERQAAILSASLDPLSKPIAQPIEKHPEVEGEAEAVERRQALLQSTHREEQTSQERQVADPGPTTALENQDHNAQREHWERQAAMLSASLDPLSKPIEKHPEVEGEAEAVAELDKNIERSEQLEQFLIHLDEEIQHMESAIEQHKYSELLGACRWIARYSRVLGFKDLVVIVDHIREIDLVTDSDQVLTYLDELKLHRTAIVQRLEEAGDRADSLPFTVTPAAVSRREPEVLKSTATAGDSSADSETPAVESLPVQPVDSQQPQRAKFLDMMPRQLTYLEEAWFERKKKEFQRICRWIIRYAKILEFPAIREVAEKVLEMDWRTQAAQVNFQLRYLETIFDNTSLPARHILRSKAHSTRDANGLHANIPVLEAVVLMQREQDKQRSQTSIVFQHPPVDILQSDENSEHHVVNPVDEVIKSEYEEIEMDVPAQETVDSKLFTAGGENDIPTQSTDVSQGEVPQGGRGDEPLGESGDLRLENLSVLPDVVHSRFDTRYPNFHARVDQFVRKLDQVLESLHTAVDAGDKERIEERCYWLAGQADSAGFDDIVAVVHELRQSLLVGDPRLLHIHMDRILHVCARISVPDESSVDVAEFKQTAYGGKITGNTHLAQSGLTASKSLHSSLDLAKPELNIIVVRFINRLPGLLEEIADVAHEHQWARLQKLLYKLRGDANGAGFTVFNGPIKRIQDSIESARLDKINGYVKNLFALRDKLLENVPVVQNAR